MHQPRRHSARHPIPGRHRLALPALLMLALPSAARAQAYRVKVSAAAMSDVERELSSAVRAPVRIRGGAGRQLTLSATADTAAALLDRVAASLGGQWRLRL